MPSYRCFHRRTTLQQFHSPCVRSQAINAKMRRLPIEQIPQPKPCHSESIPITQQQWASGRKCLYKCEFMNAVLKVGKKVGNWVKILYSFQNCSRNHQQHTLHVDITGTGGDTGTWFWWVHAWLQACACKLEHDGHSQKSMFIFPI